MGGCGYVVKSHPPQKCLSGCSLVVISPPPRFFGWGCGFLLKSPPPLFFSLEGVLFLVEGCMLVVISHPAKINCLGLGVYPFLINSDQSDTKEQYPNWKLG